MYPVPVAPGQVLGRGLGTPGDTVAQRPLHVPLSRAGAGTAFVSAGRSESRSWTGVRPRVSASSQLCRPEAATRAPADGVSGGNPPPASKLAPFAVSSPGGRSGKLRGVTLQDTTSSGQTVPFSAFYVAFCGGFTAPLLFSPR